MIDYKLAKGAHVSREAGMCAMEWVAYVAGEKHSDQPGCVSPVLKSFCIAFNDTLPDDQRQRLRPYLTRCIGTNGDGLDEQRAWMTTDWLIREFTPTWLDLGGFHAHAQNLRSLGTVLSIETLKPSQRPLGDARNAAAVAWDAARAVVRDPARDVARAVAWEAAGDAARAVAWAGAGAVAWEAVWEAAWAAVRDAAGGAARAAARDAAWAAAGDAVRDVARTENSYDKSYQAAFKVMKPTSDELIDLAFGLLDRMLPTEHVVIPEPFKAELDRLCAA